MFEKLKRKSFKFKIMMTYILGLIIIGVSGYGYFIASQVRNLNNQVKEQREELIKQYKFMARTAVAVAENMINVMQNLALEGKLSKEQLKRMALENLNTIKYAPAGYVWCIKEDGTVLLDPPKPEITGKNIFKLKSAPYTTLAKLIENFRIQNGDFIEYDWYYPGIDSRTFKKISFVKDIPSVHWIIGSGFYLKDIEDRVNLFKEKQMRELIKSILLSLIPGIASSLVSLLIMYMLVLKMIKSVEDVADIAGRLIEDEASVNMKLPVITDGAIGKLIHNTNQYIEHLTKMIKFKEDLELTETEEEIFQLIGEFMEREFNVTKYRIYSVKDDKLRLVREKGELQCQWHDKCMKAAKKGIIMEEVCTENENYICYPIMSSQELMGVIELTLKKENLKVIKKTLNKFIQSSGHNINIKRLTKTLRELSLKDKLTDLYNRRFLEETIQAITSAAERQNIKIGIVMIDIDDFKKVNDTYGHSAGDEALKTVADILKAHFRRKSDLIVRYGGEEFLVIVQDVEENRLVEMLKEFKDEVSTTLIKSNGSTMKLTVSVGYSIFPVDTRDIKEAIEFADKALYKAKASGKNKIVRFKGGKDA